MKYTVIIPARFASARLPGKPLADICGRSMIHRVYEQAKLSEAKRVIVATDHPEIVSAVKDFGGEVLMTRDDHESGTDRLAEVVEVLGLADDEIVVNVQGDEPLIPPSVIEQVASNLHCAQNASVATVSERISDLSLYLNPNTVKVVSDINGIALYFSRAPIPWHRELLTLDELDASRKRGLEDYLNDGNSVQKHVGIYAYKVGLLKAFTTWPMAALEAIEKLEQLRVMANGHRIHVQEANEPVPVGIDTPEDLELARQHFSGA